MDGFSHHDHQKRDLQVSRKGVIDSWKGVNIGKREAKRGGQLNGQHHESACTYKYVVTHVYLYLMNIVFRL